MALLKCPDCGKMVSERATACPDCGCPREFFEGEKKEEIAKLSFQLAGRQIEVPGEEYQWYAKVFGDFVKLADTSVSWMTELYRDSNSIEKALEKVPAKASEIMNATIQTAIKILYSSGIQTTPEEFLDKYYYSHQMNYEEYYSTIVEGYASIMNCQNQLAAYRQAQIASRGRWSGGGFGVSGAVKGAISASLLNAGSDFLHSFGDSARRRADNREINKMCKEYYELPETQQLLCDSIGECILQVYLAMTEELKANGQLSKEVFCFDREKAFTLYENTFVYEENHEKFVDNIIECIKLWPAEKEFYDNILGDVYAHINDGEEQSNFYAFMNYWGLNEFFKEKPSNRVQTESEKTFISKVQTALEGTSIRKNEKVKFLNTPFELLPEDTKKRLITRVREPFIGHYILFLSDEFILTDVLVSDFYHDAVMLADIKKMVNEQSGVFDDNENIFDSGKIVFVRKDSTSIAWDRTGSCDGRNITALVNVGIGAEHAEREWKSRIENYDFGRGFKDNNFKIEIKSEDDYVQRMRYIASVCSKRGVLLRESAEASIFLPAIEGWKITGKAKELSWISEELSENEFWSCIDFIKELQRSYLNKMWVGDVLEEKYAPYNNIETQLLQYGELLMFKNFGVMKSVGFALTDKYLVVLEDMVAIKNEDIRVIKIADKSHIVINDGNRDFLIKVAGTFNMEEDDWSDAKKLQHVLNIIILYVTRYGNNHHLRLEETKSKENKAEKNAVIEDFDTYMNKLGYTIESKLSTDFKEVQNIVDAIFRYVKNNNYEGAVTKRTVEDHMKNTNMDMVCTLYNWICELDEREKNGGILRESKIYPSLISAELYEHIPQLEAREYWKAIKAIAATLDKGGYEYIRTDKLNQSQSKLLKILDKVNVNPNEVVLYRANEKLLSMSGFVLTRDMAIDLKKKTKVMLVDVIEVIPERYNFYIDLRTTNAELRLAFYEEDQFAGRITSFVAGALKQYISRLKKEKSREQIVAENAVEAVEVNTVNESKQTSTEVVKKQVEQKNEEANKIKETIFCPYCGKQILRNAKFCNFCGKQNNYGKES